MEIEQTTELTYTKVEDIDKKINEILDVVTDSKPESSTSLKELVNEIKSDTDSLETKIDTILENQASGGSFDTTNLETQISELATNIDTINTTIYDISSDITTTNSNVATNKSNITSIKSTIDKIADNVPTANKYNIIDNKLNEILRLINKNVCDNEFIDDPYKLDETLYTDRIEINRNPSNYDYIENTQEFTTQGNIFACIADCTGSTFDYNITIQFSCNNTCNLSIISNSESTSKGYSAGTYTKTFSKQNVTVKNEKITFEFYASANLTVQHIKLELWGENVIILPKKKRFKINYSNENMFITKVENNNGYYLKLNSRNLYPKLLEQEFTLDAENVRDYDYGYILTKTMNSYFSIIPIRIYTNFKYQLYGNLNENYFNFYNISYIFTSCNIANSINNNHFCSMTAFKSRSTPCCYSYKLTSANSTLSNLTLESGNIVENCIPQSFNLNDVQLTPVYIFTTIKGITYFALSNTVYLELGYGQNVTAFYDKENPLRVNVYMNDGGYCVRKVVEFNENRTEIHLISNLIIGMYDAYFETPSDVYIIEKDKKLYMFKNAENTTDNLESEENI